MKTKTSLFLFVILLCGVSQSQTILSVDDAVQLALKNNYDIMVAHNDAEIAKVNNTLGNAGILPTVSLNAANTYALNHIDQKITGGTQTSVNNAVSNSFSAGPMLLWTLFDGGKMFITKKQLEETDSLGTLQFKDKVSQTIYAVIIAYYNIVSQKQQLASLNNVIAYNQDRVTIFQTGFDAGLSVKTDLLQAKIDLNVNKENAINQQNIIVAAKRSLNQLLCRDPETVFEVTDSITTQFSFNKRELLDSLVLRNTNIRSMEKQVAIAKLNVQIAQSMRYPRLTLSGGYDFVEADNTKTSPLLNRVYGPQIGAALVFPLYQSGNISRQLDVAKLQLQSAHNDLENIKEQLTVQLQNACDDFTNQQTLLTIEKDNVMLAKENLDISLQRLKLGQSISLEVKLAEQSYEEALTRLIAFEYNLKVSETKLKLLIAHLSLR